MAVTWGGDGAGGGRVVRRIRLRKGSNLARPYICRLTILMRLTAPSTGPKPLPPCVFQREHLRVHCARHACQRTSGGIRQPRRHLHRGQPARVQHRIHRVRVDRRRAYGDPADRVSTCYGGRTRYETSPRHHAAIRRGAQNYGSRAHMTSASPCGWNYPRLARSCGSSNLKAIPLIAVSIFASRIASTGCSHLSRVHTRFSG
jgi:hypothetical protein